MSARCFWPVGGITQTIIELEFSHFFEKRRVRRMIEKLDDHYIVCGFGRVGRGAAHELQRDGVPFLVIDSHEDKVERAMRAGMLAVLGDATRDENLRDLGISRAKGLIAALSTDADNLFLILSAKGLNPKLKISARVLEEESEQKFRRAGADAVLHHMSSPVHASHRPFCVRTSSSFWISPPGIQGCNVTIEQVRVSESCEYVSQSLGQMQLRREVGVIVLAIRKAAGTMLFNPDADAELAGGDYLIAMGEPQQLRRLEKLLTEARS